jgi:hypothetical protein
MRILTAVAVMPLLVPLCRAGNKLTLDERMELTRGLTAEYATAKQLLPRSKKPLEFEANGKWDRKKWEEIAKDTGVVAHTGDQVQVTSIAIESDRIVLEINGGTKSNRKWYQRVQIGPGSSTTPVPQTPAPQGGASASPGGTSIAILFHRPLESIKTAEIKKILAPVLDFDPHSATELYIDTLPPEVKKAIQEKRVMVGMDREQVIMALGRPNHKSRETDKENVEVEEWVFGVPPGKITFVTFQGSKVIRVKEAYAGLGTEVAEPTPPR